MITLYGVIYIKDTGRKKNWCKMIYINLGSRVEGKDMKVCKELMNTYVKSFYLYLYSSFCKWNNFCIYTLIIYLFLKVIYSSWFYNYNDVWKGFLISFEEQLTKTPKKDT